MATILVIEDDLTFSRILVGFLSRQGFTVENANKGSDGIRLFANSNIELVLLDYRLPDTTGLDVLAEIKKERPRTQVIIMTSFSDIRTAVKAMQMGAFEYITKPVNPDELLMVVNQALHHNGSRSGASVPATAKKFVVGRSPSAMQIQDHVRLVAPTDMSVIIEGESGTGKENVARSIHQLSSRSSESFVAVDCGALSRELAASELFGHVRGAFTGAVQDKLGQFEEAHRGTLFLDEVGNLSIEIQMKLLRALQERVIQRVGSAKEIKVDVRIITATNEDLYERVRRGNFREDLYHRLNEFKLKVSPMRDRTEDLNEFLDFFRQSANEELARNVIGFSEPVRRIFESYDWPGNLREMKNVVRRAVLLTQGDIVDVQALPQEMVDTVQNPIRRTTNQPVTGLKSMQELQEKDMIIRTLEAVKFNKSKAARILKIDRKTLYLKIEKYGIK